MRCVNKYSDIEAPDYKDNSDYFEDFIERYIDKWGEQSDEDFDIIHLYWYTLGTDYLDESVLETSVNEMRESLVWYFKRSSEQKSKDIRVLQEQIEKMKNCKNCENYMISGKCPSFFRTGWCKNWEMTKGVKND